MNILVTGGAGYVGSHACKPLATKGHVPITYDNLSRGSRWAVKWGPFEKGEITDLRHVRTVLKKYRPSAVMHFAAYAYVADRFGYVNAPTFVYNCRGADRISNDERRAAQGYKQVVKKHLLPIMFKLGPRAISRHRCAIARHYYLAGEVKLARISSLSAFLWWPSPRATIHCARAV